MIHWICDTKDCDKTPLTCLLQKLGIVDISQRLRWARRVQRATSCIKSVTDLAIPGTRGRGKPGKIWSECVKNDVRESDPSGIDPQDRDARKDGVRRCLVLPTPSNGTRTYHNLLLDVMND